MKLRQNLYYMAIFPYVKKFSILAKALLIKKKKKENEKILFLENERKRNKTESISTAVGRSKGGAHLDTWVMNKAYMCDVPPRDTHTHTHTR